MSQVVNNRMDLRTYRRLALATTTVALILVMVLWNLDGVGLLLYPLRLFVTYVHEASHGLAALMTGGRVIGFSVSANGSGLATTAGGWPAIILPAGYLGAALFGSGLFYLVNRFPQYAHYLALMLGLVMMVFTIAFARPDVQGSWWALVLGVTFGMGLLLMGWKLNLIANMLILNVLAVMTALNAVLDIFYLMQAIDVTVGQVANDALAFSQRIMPLVPPRLVALSWAVISLLMLKTAAWHGLIRPVHAELDEMINGMKT